MRRHPDSKKKKETPDRLSRKRYQWDKKVIKRCIIGLIMSVLFSSLWSVCRYYYKGREDISLNNSGLHYWYQLCCILMFAAFMYLFLALRKLIPKELKEELIARFNWVIERYVITPISKISQKIYEILGLSDRQRIEGKDESSFIFDTENNPLLRRLHGVKKQMRWKDLETNAEKIRYIYIKYVIKLIKSGYRYETNKTPDEVKKELNLENEPGRLFDLYRGARYSGGRDEISDVDVEMSEKLIKKR